MCGRFSLYSNPQKVAKIFSVNKMFEFEPSYNIAPTQIIPVVCELPDHVRVVLPMRWGLVPSWQKEGQISSAMINARVETINTKPAFRKAILQRRCLIVTDGFYEWKQGTSPKQPYFIRMKNHNPFGMAGIWERWVGDDKTIDSCAIITLDANKVVERVHNRMPAIISPDEYDNWLNPDITDWDTIHTLLSPYKSNEMEVYPISTMVNNARYNRPDCIEPVESQ